MRSLLTTMLLLAATALVVYPETGKGALSTLPTSSSQILPTSTLQFSTVNSSTRDYLRDYLKDRIDGFPLHEFGAHARRCTPRGMECPPQFPPCCPGLRCVPASTRAFCLPV